MTKLLDTLLTKEPLVKQGTDSHSHNVIIVILLSIALNQI